MGKAEVSTSFLFIETAESSSGRSRVTLADAAPA